MTKIGANNNLKTRKSNSSNAELWSRKGDSSAGMQSKQTICCALISLYNSIESLQNFNSPIDPLRLWSHIIQLLLKSCVLETKTKSSEESVKVESSEMENYEATNINNNILLDLDREIKKETTSEAHSDMEMTSDLSSGDNENELVEDKQSVISDTDSALSSINTVGSVRSDPSLSAIDSNLYVGKIVWGSFSKLNWFPCMIYSIEGCNDRKLLISNALHCMTTNI
jgi:hypothetical protein